MGADPGTTRIRLAELVAALSLGIDLGFGQPMEHVLRQCLIALRIAERLGLSEEERAAVYYAALLINVATRAACPVRRSLRLLASWVPLMPTSRCARCGRTASS